MWRMQYEECIFYCKILSNLVQKQKNVLKTEFEDRCRAWGSCRIVLPPRSQVQCRTFLHIDCSPMKNIQFLAP